MFPLIPFVMLLLPGSHPACASCEQACISLSQSLPTHYSADPPPPLWSKFQSNAAPICTISPSHPSHIATILPILIQHNCHFAVLGGGTSPFRGVSNAHQGVTIDMRRLNSIAFVEDEKSAIRVGAGNVWADVYRELDPWGMSATGTRNSLTGVVGSILGGGISFFSEQHGWACDTVLEFEFVLANSTFARANEVTNPYLFWALKGGGNNFAIVTSVVIEIFRDPPEWYSFQLFNMDDLAIVFERLETHTATMPARVWQIATTLQWHVATQQFAISERMVASEPPDLPESLTYMTPSGKIHESPVLQTAAYRRSILAMSQKMDGMNPKGFYNFFGSVTVRSNATVSMAMAHIFMEEVEWIKKEEDLQVYIVYNPVTRNALRKMKRRGGNALGLTEGDGPLTVVNINLHWSNERSELLMRQFMRHLIERFRESARAMDMLHPYIFQNHAFEEQDVFAGLGEGKLARLKAVRRAVDPIGVFQSLQPGYFKLEPELIDQRWGKTEL